MPSKPAKQVLGSAYARALARLARRDQSVEEVRRALLRAGYGEPETDQALARLTAERYLDDSGFAARFARSRIARHGLGRQRVRQGLRARGVARAPAEAGLREALTEVSEAETLDALARRYWRQHKDVDAPRRVQRLWVFLLRRGFPVELVGERLRALWPRWADALLDLPPLEPEADEEREGS
jgi:regulatory protein